jgi:hypothetical protein
LVGRIHVHKKKLRAGFVVPAQVGKTNTANNATDTTFKAKAIVVPAQSVTDDKGDATNQVAMTTPQLYMLNCRMVMQAKLPLCS